MTLSRKFLTAVALSAPLLSFAAPAAIDLDSYFRLESDPNVFESATVKHATWTGSIDNVGDKAWFSFTGQKDQRLWADHDDGINADSLTDTVLSLFDANGNLLAMSDDPSGVDPGSTDYGATANAFLGTYTLPSSGTYYLALTSANNVPDAVCDSTATLTQPGGNVPTGFQYSGCSANFLFTDNGFSATGSFTLQVSLADAGTAIPEPGSLSLAGLALAGLMVRRRRR